MDTEPLKSLLDYSVDKKSTILYFLSKEEQERLQEYIFEDEDFYINERILAIQKNTLELNINGTIISSDGHMITIRLNNVRNITIDTNKYYIFIRSKKKGLEKREFMKQLLEKL